jgi:phage terminase large subunit-like protein
VTFSPSDLSDSELLANLTDTEALELLYDWSLWSRPNQRAPGGDWRTWLILAGRGFGKTRSGAEFVRGEIEAGRAGRAALVAPTAADARDVMVEGESGILAISPPWNKPLYEPSKRRLTWPNGAMATLFSADEPERLRGPQSDLAWCDEPASWRYPEAFDMLRFGLRLGKSPRAVVTGTPKPIKLIRDLLKEDSTVVTRGSTYDNRANLAPAFLEQIKAKYEGTRLGLQEIYAQILDDVPGALWQRSMFGEKLREAPPMARVVVGVDPAVTSGEDSDETGIVVAGRGVDGRAYVLADFSCRLTPMGWADRVAAAYRDYGADRVIAEVNNGGDLVEMTLRTVAPNIPYKKVHASRGKRVRAEPIAALYEQGKVTHLQGLEVLEDQMCSFTPDTQSSPDRLDALVWALSELMLEPETNRRQSSFSFSTL